jgi:hypothetical protein
MPHRLVHGLGQAGGGDQVPVKHPYRRPVQGPWLVLDVGPRQHRPEGGIELPARREVVVEGAQLLWPQRGPTSTVMFATAGVGPGHRRRLR